MLPRSNRWAGRGAGMIAAQRRRPKRRLGDVFSNEPDTHPRVCRRLLRMLPG